MKTDERDQRLGALLDRAVRPASPSENLGPVLNRGRRRRAVRWTAIVAALALFVGAVTWTALSLQRGQTRWTTYAGPGSSWRFSHPANWHVTPVSQDCDAGGFSGGVIVSNVAFRFQHPQGRSLRGCLDRYLMAGFPSDGLAVALQPIGMGIGIFPSEPDTAFPLRASQLFKDGGIRGGPQESLIEITIQGERAYDLRAWVGHDASQADRVALDRVISSVDFAGTPRWRSRHSRHGFTISYPNNWTWWSGFSHGPGSWHPVLDLISPNTSTTVGGMTCGQLKTMVSIVLLQGPVYEGPVAGGSAVFHRRPPDGESCGGYQNRWTYRFVQAGQQFRAVVNVGKGDPGYLYNTALRVLNSLRIHNRG